MGITSFRFDKNILRQNNIQENTDRHINEVEMERIFWLLFMKYVIQEISENPKT